MKVYYKGNCAGLSISKKGAPGQTRTADLAVSVIMITAARSYLLSYWGIKKRVSGAFIKVSSAKN